MPVLEVTDQEWHCWKYQSTLITMRQLFSIWNNIHHTCLSLFLLLHLNTYFMHGFTAVLNVLPFRRQYLTSIDVEFWRLNSVPALKDLAFYIVALSTFADWEMFMVFFWLEIESQTLRLSYKSVASSDVYKNKFFNWAFWALANDIKMQIVLPSAYKCTAPSPVSSQCLLMLGRRRRRWPSIKKTVGIFLSFSGSYHRNKQRKAAA